MIATEAAWIAVGAVAGALTMGIGSAIVASARMARFASSVGKAVGGFRSAAMSTRVGRATLSVTKDVIRLANWMNSIPDRILLSAYGRFGNAVDRLRRRRPRYIRQGPNGGEIHGRGPGVAGRNCAIGVC